MHLQRSEGFLRPDESERTKPRGGVTTGARQSKQTDPVVQYGEELPARGVGLFAKMEPLATRQECTWVIVAAWLELDSDRRRVVCIEQCVAEGVHAVGGLRLKPPSIDVICVMSDMKLVQLHQTRKSEPRTCRDEEA